MEHQTSECAFCHKPYIQPCDEAKAVTCENRLWLLANPPAGEPVEAPQKPKGRRSAAKGRAGAKK